MIYIYIYIYYIYIYIYIFVYFFINLFHVSIVKTSRKSDEAKVEERIKRILKDAPDREGGSRIKARVEKLLINRDFVFFYRDFFSSLGVNSYCSNVNNLCNFEENQQFYLFQKEKIMLGFLFEVFEELLSRKLTRELFFAMHLIYFVCFRKEYSSTFVTAGGLTKLLMQSSSTAKTKDKEFYYLLVRLFSRFQEI